MYNFNFTIEGGKFKESINNIIVDNNNTVGIDFLTWI